MSSSKLGRTTIALTGLAAAAAIVALIVAGSWKSGSLAAVSDAGSALTAEQQNSLPRTRAEASNYAETSTHADVEAFVDSLQKLGAPIWTGSIAATAQGREVIYVVASRPRVSSPSEARRLGRPIVYVQGNIHGGEVEGKEAVQALLRDLLFSSRPNALDSVVLIVVPDYNADGNDNMGPQGRNRGSQQGPGMVGTRATSENNNLNRDYVRALSPETRGSLNMFNIWDPDIFVDLHTSNGSMHGYALTYSPPLNPASVHTIPFTRDSLLPELRRRMKARHDFDIFDYGNWRGNCDTDCRFATYDHTPRYGTNYYGLRGRIAILSEAFSHDPFERRVRSTYAFVSEILSLASEKTAAIRALSRTADERTTAWGLNPASAPPIALQSRLTTTPFNAPILVVETERIQSDTTVHEVGLGRGMRRTGRIVEKSMAVLDRFEPTLTRTLPYGWVVDGSQTVALQKLREHGVIVQQLRQDYPTRVEAFRVEGRRAGQYEGFETMAVNGTWRTEQRTLRQGSWIVPAGQPLGIVAFYLLEPESDDGLTAWTFFNSGITEGADFPVARIMQPLTAARRISR